MFLLTKKRGDTAPIPVISRIFHETIGQWGQGIIHRHTRPGNDSGKTELGLNTADIS